MDSVSKTLYIPLYGKALVSRRGILLSDPIAEAIWAREQFPLRGKARSRWLTLFMAMRARVFDDWTRAQLLQAPASVVLHIGCGLDSRVLRLGGNFRRWYDIDLPQVMAKRRVHYKEFPGYTMLAGDAGDPRWLPELEPAESAVVILEGLSMYLPQEKTAALLAAVCGKYPQVHILMDVYTSFGVRASRYKNPINTVGVTQLYGIDDPRSVLDNGALCFTAELTMTPESCLSQLHRFEGWFFRRMFAGSFAKKLYRLFEYEKQQR